MAAPKPKNGAGRDLKKAIAVGVFLGALTIASLITPLAWYPLVAVAIGLGTYEVWRRLLEAGYIVHLPVLILGGQAMVWLSWPFGTSGLVGGYATSILVLMITRLFHYGRNSPPHNYVRDVAVGTFIMTWIPLFGSFAAMISRMSTEQADGVAFLVTFMLCVVASDVGGYGFGVFFGSHPMAPSVSPKKSWEGFAGSVFTAIVVGTACVVFLLNSPFWLGIVLGIGLAVCATLGDLVESQFKRDLKLKDMSTMLPGHGGLMDRLDGMLPAAMVTWVVLNTISMA